MDTSHSANQCPSPGGLRQAGGLTQPGFHLGSLFQHPSQNWHVIGWLFCCVLIAFTWVYAFIIIARHARNYYDSHVQRHKLRVLLYPPVYATLAWFSYLRYDYSTTIMFFATLFESFAVYNLYMCLQSYLQPFRDEAGQRKEDITVKLFYFFKIHIKSKWGLHYNTITNILVFQYPIWSIIDAFISIFAELRGYYCEGSYNFHGAYVYLTIIDFVSLSVILSALFTYLAVFHEEWKRGKIHAHGMFWCVKGPIMFIFYIGDILLTALTTAGVIKGTDGTNSSDSIAWPAAAVKNGLYVIIICVVMAFIIILMAKYYGPQDVVAKHENGQLDTVRMTPSKALIDGYVTYIPEFLYGVLCCGVDSCRLARKRVELRSRKKQEMNSGGNTHLLTTQPTETERPSYSDSSEIYPMVEIPDQYSPNLGPPLPTRYESNTQHQEAPTLPTRPEDSSSSQHQVHYPMPVPETYHGQQ
ncbi:hypothetical protein K493DRAFT_255344 [Basidiobolus meristosporus CBS 931.73]|uniref:DUF300-domain-containing protein n=1 Tax=Basidiobolus meristosporus CBS 931.73 TaxID=1314790 RepID=A0A1Y1YUU1_9FUNG|nr:hypothetical protein K493DRAFT_255344 [Basidiobolus meristosporus CBS 931.73]|eukprot:ORY01771.1 hypothetical protein K493DRAFT_255344 [Basidiobolus meristosporus CBS 931.73]